MAAFNARVLAAEPLARLTKEDLAHNGTLHYSVRVGDERRWLSTPGLHTSPAVAWRGAWYCIRRRQNREPQP